MKIYRGTALSEAAPLPPPQFSPVLEPVFWTLQVRSHYAQVISFGEG